MSAVLKKRELKVLGNYKLSPTASGRVSDMALNNGAYKSDIVEYCINRVWEETGGFIPQNSPPVVAGGAGRVEKSPESTPVPTLDDGPEEDGENWKEPAGTDPDDCWNPSAVAIADPGLPDVEPPPLAPHDELVTLEPNEDEVPLPAGGVADIPGEDEGVPFVAEPVAEMAVPPRRKRAVGSSAFVFPADTPTTLGIRGKKALAELDTAPEEPVHAKAKPVIAFGE